MSEQLPGNGPPLTGSAVSAALSQLNQPGSKTNGREQAQQQQARAADTN